MSAAAAVGLLAAVLLCALPFVAFGGRRVALWSLDILGRRQDAVAREVDEHAYAAEQLLRKGLAAEACERYRRAAVIEEVSARTCSLALRDTLRVSAVALWSRAGERAEVARLCSEWLADETLQPMARAELEALREDSAP